MADKKVNLIIALKDELSSKMGGIQSRLAGLGEGFKKVALAGAAMAAAVGAALLKMNKEFIAGQEANNNLAASLDAVGMSGQKLLPFFQQYAVELQRVTKYGDDVLISAMAQGHNLGIQTSQLQEATKAAAGLAAKYGMDLQSAMMLVGRASQGQTTMLARYGIVLDETLSPQEKFNQLLKIGGESFGLAEAQTNTLAGAWTQFKNALGDAQEEIIDAMLQGDGLTEKIKMMTNAVLDLIERGDIKFWTEEVISSFGAIAKVIMPVAKAIGFVTQAVAAGTRSVGGFIGGVAGGLSTGEGFGSIKTGISSARSAHQDYLDRKEAATKAISEERAEKEKLAKETADVEFAQRDAKLKQEQEKQKSAVEEVTEVAKVGLEEAGKTFVESIADSFDELKPGGMTFTPDEFKPGAMPTPSSPSAPSAQMNIGSAADLFQQMTRGDLFRSEKDRVFQQLKELLHGAPEETAAAMKDAMKATFSEVEVMIKSETITEILEKQRDLIADLLALSNERMGGVKN